MTKWFALSFLTLATSLGAATPAMACIQGTNRHWLFAQPPEEMPAGLLVLKGRIVAHAEDEVTVELTEPISGLSSGTRVRIRELVPNCGDEFRTDLDMAYALGRFSSLSPRNAVFLALALPIAAPPRPSLEELDRHIVDPTTAREAERDRERRDR